MVLVKLVRSDMVASVDLVKILLSVWVTSVNGFAVVVLSILQNKMVKISNKKN